MSGTRTAQKGKPPRQERWASSPAFSQSLKANLVARRCSVIASREDRELVWTLQYLSMFPGELSKAGACCSKHIVHQSVLMELCLNPESDYLFKLGSGLRDYLKRRVLSPAREVVTEIGRMVCDALEYCQQSHGMVLLAGIARTGKTFAAKRWCEQHTGRARYVQVPSNGDDVSFFAAIGRALGIVIERDAKAKYLRPRIEATLQTGDLMLVLDDAQFCWQGYDYRRNRPSRICWLMTALVNMGVPVALIGTEQFLQAQHDYTKKTGWAAAQFIGRVERFVQLPDKVSLADLKRVARYWLPDGDPESTEALAHYANLSAKRMAAIEHLAKRAKYMANEAGRVEPEWADLHAALTESPMPTDTAIAGLLARSGGARRSGVPIASAAREPRGLLAVD